MLYILYSTAHLLFTQSLWVFPGLFASGKKDFSLELLGRKDIWQNREKLFPRKKTEQKNPKNCGRIPRQSGRKHERVEGGKRGGEKVERKQRKAAPSSFLFRFGGKEQRRNLRPSLRTHVLQVLRLQGGKGEGEREEKRERERRGKWKMRMMRTLFSFRLARWDLAAKKHP